MRIKLIIEYDGTDFAGWQRQLNVVTVQGVLEAALNRLTNQSITVFAAGRTDAGVHATGQVVHFDYDGTLPLRAFIYGVNFHLLGHPVAVLSAEIVDHNFDARFSAKQRQYLYRILNRQHPSPIRQKYTDYYPYELDVSLMQHAAQLLKGTNDFSAFRCSHCQAKSPIRTIDTFDMIVSGDEVHFIISARSFLHNQVRIMAGTLMEIGSGKKKISDLEMAISTGNRVFSGATRPPNGLTLSRVIY